MKIPKKAKRVFKGIIFEVYQWPQKQFDGSYQTFEMLKRPNTIEVIATQNNRLIMAIQKQPNKSPCYTLFGGRQEKEERPIQTAKRELLEESGLASKNWKLLKVYDSEHKIEHRIYFFVAKNCEKIAEQKLDSGEKIKLITVTFKQFLKIVYSEKLWCGPLVNDLFKIKNNSQKLKEFKNRLF